MKSGAEAYRHDTGETRTAATATKCGHSEGPGARQAVYDDAMLNHRVLMHALLLCSFPLAGHCVRARQREAPTAKSQGPRTFSDAESLLGARPVPEDMNAAGFRFSSSGSSYEITYDGNGKRTEAKGVTLSFRLDLDEKEAYLVRVFYTEFSGDLIIVCEATDWETGWGFIARLDGGSLKPKWRGLIRGFNVGQGLVEDHYAYLTAIGFVGKVDLDSGTYIWRHDDLHVDFFESVPHAKCCHFNSFEAPKLEGDAVIFEEQKPENPPTKALTIDKRTGEILNLSK